MFSKRLQDEIWGENPDATASSSIAPFGKAQNVEGGIILNGELGWSSGCDHAEWAIVGFRRPAGEGEPPVYCFGVVPRADYEIRDDWFVAGMRSSGTKTLILKDVFIPDHRIEAAKDMMEGRSAGFDLYPDSKIFYAPIARTSPAASRPSAWASPSACWWRSPRRRRTACAPTPASASAPPPRR